MTAPTPLLAGLCSVTLRASSIAEVVEAAVGCRPGRDRVGRRRPRATGRPDAAAEARRRERRRPASPSCPTAPTSPAPRRSVATWRPCSTRPRRSGTSIVRVWCPFGIEPGAADGARAEVVDAVTPGGRRGRRPRHRRVPRVPRRHAHRVGRRRPSPCSTPSARRTSSPPGSRPTGSRRTSTPTAPTCAPSGRAWPTCTSTSGIPTAVAIRSPPAHDVWPDRLASAASIVGAGAPGRAALLEFVTDDDPAALAADAATLRRWLAAVPGDGAPSTTLTGPSPFAPRRARDRDRTDPPGRPDPPAPAHRRHVRGAAPVHRRRRRRLARLRGPPRPHGRGRHRPGGEHGHRLRPVAHPGRPQPRCWR